MKEITTTYLLRKVTMLFVTVLVFGMAFGITLPKLLEAFAASAPNIVSYQGRILNDNGVPVSDATVDMKFELYTASAGGTCIWSNSSANCDGNTPASTVARTITLTDGLFSENLGDTTLGSPYAAIGDSIFADNAAVYLQVYIEGETLTPRKQIVSAPYAMNSDTLDGLSSADFDFDQIYDNDTDGILNVDNNDLEFSLDAVGLDLLVDMQSTGNLIIQDAGVEFASFANDGVFTFTSSGSSRFVVEGATNDVAHTSGLIDMDMDSATDGASAFNLNVESLLSNAAGTETITGLSISPVTNVTSGAGTHRLYGVYIQNLTETACAAGTCEEYGIRVGQNYEYAGYLEGDVVIGPAANGDLLVGATSVSGVNAAFTLSGDDIFAEGGIAAQDNMYADIFVAGDSSTSYGDGTIITTGATDLGLTIAGGDLTFAQNTVIGDGGDLLSINSSDWDISTIGDMTNIGSISADSDVTLSLAGTENFVVTNTTGDNALDLFTLSITNTDTTAAAQQGMMITNEAASTSATEAFITLRNLDALTVPDGIVLTGLITDAIDVSNGSIVNALNVDANFIQYDALRVAELATNTLTWEDSGGTDLMTLTDGGSYSILDVDGAIYAGGGVRLSDSLPVITTVAGSNIIIYGGNNGADPGEDVVLVGHNAFLSNSGALSLTPDTVVTTGLDVSDTDFTNAIDVDANFILHDGIRFFEGSTGTLTWEDTSGNDLMRLVDDGTSGTLTVTNDIVATDDITATGTLTGLDITCSGGDCIDFTELEDNLNLDDNLVIAQGTYAWSHQYGNTTGTAFSVSGLATTTGGIASFTGSTLTTGFGLNVSTSSASFSNTSTGLVNFSSSNASSTGRVLYINNDGTGSAVLINQDGDTGSTVNDVAGGALHISNTGNDDYGLTIYTNNGATVNQPLAYFFADNAAFDQPVVTIANESTAAGSSAFHVEQKAAGTIDPAINIEANVVGYAMIMVNDAGGGIGADNRQGLAIQGCLYTNPTGACNLVELRDGNGTVIGAIEGNGAGGVTNASAGSDYAELFPGNYSDFAAGDVISLDASGNAVIASVALDMIGAFSVAPNTLGNWVDDWQDTGVYVPVALLGQVPVNVNDEGGAIAVGDYVTLSSTPGVARKATGVGYVLGRALESHASGADTIKVLIQPKWHALDILTEEGSATLSSADMILGATGIATGVDLGKASRALTLRGSGWDGAAAQDVEMVMLTEAAGSGDYRLSIRNTGGIEVAHITQDGDLALSGRLYPSDRGTAQTDKYIYYDGSSGFGGDFMRTNASGWGTGSYDFAEMFPSDQTLSPGEVVVFASDDEHVERSTGRTYDPGIAGIISTKPGFLAGENIDGHVPVALAGRVPTYVTSENGTIKPGDPLTTSTKAGYAMKATEPGPILGYAMEPFSGNTGSIIAFVRASYYDGRTLGDAPAAINTASGLSTSISNFDISGSLNLNGGSIISIGSLSGVSSHWRLEEEGDLFSEGRFIHIVKSYQGEDVETYGALSRETTIQLSGTASLVGGTAHIDFESIDPSFNDVISTTQPYRVFVTASNATGSLYAINRTPAGFDVRESEGVSSTLVDWLVIAYHKDFEPSTDQTILKDSVVAEDSEEVNTESAEVNEIVEQAIEDPAEETGWVIVDSEEFEQIVEDVASGSEEVIAEDAEIIPTSEEVIEEPALSESTSEALPEPPPETTTPTEDLPPVVE
ncbi:MAG: hypothetical protein ABIA47_03250 [bacterium]